MMNGKHRRAKYFLIGVVGSLVPCLAMAVNMPTGPFLEKINTAAMDAGLLAPPAAARPDWAIQVGAFSEQAAAGAQIAHIASLSSIALGDAASAILPMPWHEKETLYRARFVGLSEDRAHALCAKLLALQIPCIVIAGQPADQSGSTMAATEETAKPDAIGSALAGGTGPADALTPPGADVRNSPRSKKDVAAADTPKGSLLDSAGRVGNRDLAKMRGGFFTAAGAKFDFGASVQTMVNGQLALLSTLNWTPSGPHVQQLAGLGQSIQTLVADNLAKAGIPGADSVSKSVSTPQIAKAPVAGTTPQITSAPQPDPVTMTSTVPQSAGNLPSAGPALAAVSPPPLDTGVSSGISNHQTNAVQGGVPAPTGNSPPVASFVSNLVPTTLNKPPVNSDPPHANGGGSPAPAAGPQVLSGVQIPGVGGGTTQVLANLSGGQIQNIVLNTASNQTITQSTNVTLTIYNFHDWQKQLSQNLLANQLVNEMLAASGLRGGH